MPYITKKRVYYCGEVEILCYITYGYDPKEFVIYPERVFREDFKIDWLNTDLAKSIIESIDLSIHEKDRRIWSPILGDIGPNELSTGCKATLICAFMDRKMCGERMGDNCYPVLSEIGQKRDVHVSLAHNVIIKKGTPFEATITNNRRVVHTTKDLINGGSARSKGW